MTQVVTQDSLAHWLYTAFWNYNIGMGVVAIIALLFTRSIWYRQSRYARIAWLALMIYTIAIVYGTYESMRLGIVPGPRGALFTCAVTFVVIVCAMFYVDKHPRRR